ncbi:hypothetical protein H1230_06900 [Paenibacillus sp. 19GGS1-52]|uniref:hypothetical protein n=1 Tax=Paenibacillus sp. 19GGS1-52 TaxID=2758563 RepID=UPI001EFBF2FB|nr:hypothetical protein [Paenibacillus sp. 19GGS1-52]ULO08529.1 hypothetical protein H1230_06900 [Paenibacillus sp. 19GGS1-52]
MKSSTTDNTIFTHRASPSVRHEVRSGSERHFSSREQSQPDTSAPTNRIAAAQWA